MTDKLAQKLAEEAMHYAYNICKENNRKGGVGDHIWFTLTMGRYTELLVEECARSCERVGVLEQEEPVGSMYAHAIREKFDLSKI